jgi:rhodanese-related sulfurtransferase
MHTTMLHPALLLESVSFTSDGGGGDGMGLLLNIFSLAAWILMLFLVLRDRDKLKQAKADAEAAKDQARRANNAKDELAAEVGNLRELLARSVEGEPLTREMVMEGQLWRDIDGQKALELFGDAGAHILDVRTPSEMASGVIKGALLIPMDEIGQRSKELPSDGRPILIYCAAGGRSAAVCEHLSTEGVGGLHNLEGGFGAWRGETQTP